LSNISQLAVQTLYCILNLTWVALLLVVLLQAPHQVPRCTAPTWVEPLTPPLHHVSKQPHLGPFALIS
jgi:hypothetical protein